MVTLDEFLTRLKKERKDAGFSQENISNMFQKADAGFYGKKENGLHPLPVGELIPILDKLGYDIMDVFEKKSTHYPVQFHPILSMVVEIMQSGDSDERRLLERYLKSAIESIRKKVEEQQPQISQHDDTTRGAPPTKQRGSSAV